MTKQEQLDRAAVWQHRAAANAAEAMAYRHTEPCRAIAAQEAAADCAEQARIRLFKAMAEPVPA